jgi:hypothetical protein
VTATSTVERIEMVQEAAAAARQFSFRLPGNLVERVEGCAEEIRAAGLQVTRADVVRLLLTHALDATHCKLELLVGGKAPQKRRRRRAR